jgi:hypothetical protein
MGCTTAPQPTFLNYMLREVGGVASLAKVIGKKTFKEEQTVTDVMAEKLLVQAAKRGRGEGACGGCGGESRTTNSRRREPLVFHGMGHCLRVLPTAALASTRLLPSCSATIYLRAGGSPLPHSFLSLTTPPLPQHQAAVASWSPFLLRRLLQPLRVRQISPQRPPRLSHSGMTT